MAITIENLSTLAINNTVRTLGSGLPHATINFDFNGTARSICLDDWVNAGAPTITNIDAALAAEVIPKDNAKATIASWKGTKSLFEMFAKGEYFEGQAANWHAPGGNAATHDVSVHRNAPLANAAQQTMFMLLVAGAAVAYYRESTMAALNVSTVDVTHPQAHAAHLTQVTQVALNWAEVLKQARLIAKGKIDADTAPPAYGAPNLNNTYDTEMFNAATAAGGGFTSLINTYGVFTRGHGNNGYDWWHSGTTFLGSAANLRNGVQAALNAALNHIRFVLYMEWRLGYELKSGTAAHA